MQLLWICNHNNAVDQQGGLCKETASKYWMYVHVLQLFSYSTSLQLYHQNRLYNYEKLFKKLPEKIIAALKLKQAVTVEGEDVDYCLMIG